MTRFIATLTAIMLITAAAFYFISVPNEWEPQTFRLAILAAYLGFAFAMALYHLFLFFFTSKEHIYLIFAVTAILMALRLASIPGSVAELVTPVGGLPLLYHISEIALPGVYIFGHWFSHIMLRIKWGGVPTRVIYTVTLGLPLAMTVITGHGEIIWLFMCGIPHLFIICKGLASKHCRSNPYTLIYICILIIFFIFPLLVFPFPSMRNWFAPAAPFWLMWMLIQAVLLSNSYGEIKYREHKLSEEKILLESLNRTKTEFFGNISHEMKTPLTIIATDIQLAEQFADCGNLDAAKELMREAWHETMHTANLVTDALAFSRGQEVSKQPEPLNFGVVIESALAVFEPLIKKQGNTLIRDIAKQTQINGNADMLAGALVNLLSNANRYTNNGIIKVQWTAYCGQYCLTVCDNGSGIAPEILPRVFDRGVTDGTGTGLGLSIVKSITELHGGEISIESTVGKGTTVTLMFPMLLEEQI